MNMRLLLALLFVLTLAFLCGFLAVCAHILYAGIGQSLPPTMIVGSMALPIMEALHSGIGLFLLFVVLIFLLLFLLIDRLIITPVKAIAAALNAFTQNGAQVPLPAFSRTSKEIRMLSDAFVQFTDNVELVHKRDMEISRVKSDFISTAAHQLRTPLTGIRWALEALQNEALSEDQKALVKNAVDKSHDLVAIVGTLLDISSIESGKYKYVFAPADLDALVSSVTKDFAPLADKNNVKLYYAKTNETIPQITIDRDRIKWLLNNLVENAIRYTPGQGTVQVTVEQSADRIFVKVKDTGIGIPDKDRNNIFERFFRAGNAISKENQGNGLGLYIARQIAVDHGGDLSFAANTDSTGTTFILALPIVR